MPDTIRSSFSGSPLMSDIRNRYAKIPVQSPLLSGVYSAILPGSGKMYLGYKLQGITALATHLLLALQAVEAYRKDGAASPRFVITAGLFGVFYTGNIWGSVLLAKKKKRDYLKQLDYEILDFHNTVVSKSID